VFWLVVESEDAERKMDGADVLRHGQKIRCFLGVFELADLAKLNIVKNNVSLIVIHNEHAIAIFCGLDQVEVFDPFGLEGRNFGNRQILDVVCGFLKEHLPCKSLRINTSIQSSGSQKCAYFCLVYLFFRCRGYTFGDVVNLFSCNLQENDRRVEELFNLHFH